MSHGTLCRDEDLGTEIIVGTSCPFATPPMSAHVEDRSCLSRGVLYPFTYFLEFLESKGEWGETVKIWINGVKWGQSWEEWDKTEICNQKMG